MAARCPRCGFENTAEALKCSSCGFDLIESTAALKPDELPRSPEITVPRSAKKRTLTVIFPENIEETFELEEGTYKIGRNPDSEIFLNDLTVSRNHAELIVEKDRTVISDLGSLNGTFVNNEIVEAPHPLKQGDIIQIGRFKLLFLAGEVREDE
jgi:pSer/pThr/pTyr-binding forkhead associated (FHA) protein